MSSMTRIDFYILDSNTLSARMEFCARLCQKACSRGLSVTIVTTDSQTAAKLDDFLWQYPPESYLPHALWPCDSPMPPTIICTHSQYSTHQGFWINDESIHPDATRTQTKLFINLATQPLSIFPANARGAEIVVQAPEILTESRTRFRHYQTSGYNVQSHKIDGRS